MANVQVSSESDGSDPYMLPINPYGYDVPTGQSKKRVEVLHGAAAYQERHWDSRPRTLVWQGLYASASYEEGIGFVAQFNVMRNWVGNIRYFNFRSMDDMNKTWPVSGTWKKCRVIDVVDTYMPADQSPIPRFNEVRVIIQPEQ